MAKKPKKLTAKQKKQEAARQQRRRAQRKRLLVVAALVLALILIEIIGPSTLWDLLPFGSGSSSQVITDPDAPLASFFAPEVLHWQSRIQDWAQQYQVNPNVIAIVMQIESCGNPSAISYAGATGLMQVMPFHFANGENMLNPDINVRRGMGVFNECLKQFADWDLGLALACYNGGPSVTQRDFNTWANETQSYYEWATGLWNEVMSGERDSQTLSDWLNSGGEILCSSADRTLFPPTPLPGSAGISEPEP